MSMMLGVVGVFFCCIFGSWRSPSVFHNAMKSLILNTAAYGTHPVEAFQSPKHIVLFVDSLESCISVAGRHTVHYRYGLWKWTDIPLLEMITDLQISWSKSSLKSEKMSCKSSLKLNYMSPGDFPHWLSVELPVATNNHFQQCYVAVQFNGHLGACCCRQVEKPEGRKIHFLIPKVQRKLLWAPPTGERLPLREGSGATIFLEPPVLPELPVPQ